MVPVASRLLKEWRKDAGKTQGEAAAEIVGPTGRPIRQATLSEYESGRKTPRTTTALNIAKLTDGAVPVSAWGEFEPEPAEGQEHQADKTADPAA